MCLIYGGVGQNEDEDVTGEEVAVSRFGPEMGCWYFVDDTLTLLLF